MERKLSACSTAKQGFQNPENQTPVQNFLLKSQLLTIRAGFPAAPSTHEPIATTQRCCFPKQLHPQEGTGLPSDLVDTTMNSPQSNWGSKGSRAIPSATPAQSRACHEAPLGCHWSFYPRSPSQLLGSLPSPLVTSSSTWLPLWAFFTTSLKHLVCSYTLCLPSSRRSLKQRSQLRPPETLLGGIGGLLSGPPVALPAPG